MYAFILMKFQPQHFVNLTLTRPYSSYKHLFKIHIFTHIHTYTITNTNTNTNAFIIHYTIYNIYIDEVKKDISNDVACSLTSTCICNIRPTALPTPAKIPAITLVNHKNKAFPFPASCEGKKKGHLRNRKTSKNQKPPFESKSHKQENLETKV